MSVTVNLATDYELINDSAEYWATTC